MRAELIQTTERLFELHDAWAQLWEQCAYATPFQTPAWNLAWWEHLGHGKLFTVAAWDDDRLAGLAPLFIYHDSDADVRRFLFLGTSITDQMDVLLQPGSEQQALSAIWEALRAHDSEWDVLDLQDVPSWSPLLTLHSLPFAAEKREHDLCRVAPLAASVQQWREQLPHGLKRNLRRYREKLEAKESISLVLCTAETRKKFFDAFLKLHEEQWQAEGQAGMLAEERVRRFHQTVVCTLPDGVARFAALKAGDEIVAVVYFLACRGKAYAYLSGYSPRLAAFSPGSIALGFAFETAIELGLSEWDFLRGREAYKAQWGAQDRVTWRLLAEPR